MTNTGGKRVIGVAAGLALALHLVLFFAVYPAPASGLGGVLVPPDTHYLTKVVESLPVNGTDARLVWSPLLFSLPSAMGFSGDSLQKTPRTPSIDLLPVELGEFLEVHAFSRGFGAQVLSQEHMLVKFDPVPPRLPAREPQPEGRQPSARRVYLESGLKARLVGGIVLPPELNKEAKTAWEVHASVTVSGQGMVQHVLLDQPLESAELNNQVQRLLRSLHFKPGESPVDGRIEIYSPEIPVSKERQP